MEWDPGSAGDDPFAGQVVMVGIYDGHGGSAVAQYLRQELHGIIESVNKGMVPELYAWVKEIGGYFRVTADHLCYILLSFNPISAI